MAELVKIPVASAEYQTRFERPHIGFISHDKARACEAVFTALLPFNLRLSNTELILTGTPADHKAIFRIPERGIIFEFGAEEYRFSKESASWATIEDDREILLAAENALMEGSGVRIASCMVRIAMHLLPLTKRREEILAPFIPEPFQIFRTQRQIRSYGTQLLFEDGDVLLDFSLGYDNGIFLRFSSRFNGHPPVDEVLTKVRSDQGALFGILDVEEAPDA